MELPILTYLLLAGAGFFGGLVDSMAGGGGLISLPALLAAGLPPHSALATNKVQSAMGKVAGISRYIRNGLVALRPALLGGTLAFVGSLIGAEAVLRIPATFLEDALPWLIAIVAAITLIKPDLGLTHNTGAHSRRRLTAFAAVAGLLGAYDGFFGPGAGSFLIFSIVALMGYDFVRSSALSKILNFMSNLAAIIAFTIGGVVLWQIAVVMGTANIIGAWTGAGLAIKNGAKFIRPIFLAVLMALLLKILLF